jgi:hypothetical protein
MFDSTTIHPVESIEKVDALPEEFHHLNIDAEEFYKATCIGKVGYFCRSSKLVEKNAPPEEVAPNVFLFNWRDPERFCRLHFQQTTGGIESYTTWGVGNRWG